jgi:hypothetical protein
MGWGKFVKNIKKAAGSALNALPGAKSGIYDMLPTAIGSVGALRIASASKKDSEQLKSANDALNQTQASLTQTKASLAEEARLRLIAEQSADAQAQQERTRTNFAGSSIQSLLERKKLLGS